MFFIHCELLRSEIGFVCFFVDYFRIVGVINFPTLMMLIYKKKNMIFLFFWNICITFRI